MQKGKTTATNEPNPMTSGRDDVNRDIVNATVPIGSRSTFNQCDNNIDANGVGANAPQGNESPLYQTTLNDGYNEQNQQNQQTSTTGMLEIDNGFNDLPIPLEFRYSEMNTPYDVTKRKQGTFRKGTIPSDSDKSARSPIAPAEENLIAANRLTPAQVSNQITHQAQVSFQVNRTREDNPDQNSFDIRLGLETNSRTRFYEVEATLVQSSTRSTGNGLFPEAFAQTQVTAATPVIDGVLVHDNVSYASDNDCDIISNEDNGLDLNPESEASPTTSCWKRNKWSLTTMGLVVIGALAGSIATVVGLNNSNNDSEPILLPFPIAPITPGQGPSPSESPAPSFSAFPYYPVNPSPSLRPNTSAYGSLQPAPSPSPSDDSVESFSTTPIPYDLSTRTPTTTHSYGQIITTLPTYYLKPDWERCADSNYCQSGCCSATLSEDSLLRCTPYSIIGGFRSDVCVTKYYVEAPNPLLDNWESCTASSSCSSGCCSSSYSDDGTLKCTYLEIEGGFRYDMCANN